MTPQFASPSAPGGGIDLKAVNGSLLLIHVHAVESGITTVHGPCDAIRADVTVLDGPTAGEEYVDTLLFPKVLTSQLRGQIGQKVLGRLGQGQAKSGQSPPWILDAATPDDTKTAIDHLAETTVTSADQPPF